MAPNLGACVIYECPDALKCPDAAVEVIVQYILPLPITKVCLNVAKGEKG